MERAVKASDGTWFLGFMCDNCGVMSLGAAQVPGPEPQIARTQMDRASDEIITWYPHRLLGRRFEDVPIAVDAAASEVWACHSIAQYRAAVLMARAVVEAIAKEQGRITGTLVSKIDELYNAEIIGKGLKEAAHEIRFLGNDMAHGDFVVAVTEEECADVLTFLEELLTEVYQRPARLNAFRERRLARKAD